MKTRVVIVSCLVSAGIASAQPKAPPKPAPRPMAPCAPLDGASPRFVSAGGTTTACFTSSDETPVETCFAFSATQAPKAVTAPAKSAAKPVSEVKQDAGAWAVCTGGACKPVGKKLAAALATAAKEAKENDATATFTALASDDGKHVAFGSNLWVVAGDKKLKLKAPKEYKGNIDKPELGGVELVGGAIIANWYNCAGPCTQAVLVDAKGANRGKWFGGGFAFPLDAKRLGVLSIESANEFVVIDVATAKQTSRLAIDMGGVTPAGAAKVDESTAVIAYQTENGWTVGFVAAPAGKPVAKGAMYNIAACPR
ncbi:MAG: hypothetical protein JNL83_00415 [Myxococcales bacterium]|nr:hypothetical protein [Myxococcales bacterium]